MKKYYILGIIACALVLAPTLGNAEEGTDAMRPVPPPIKDQIRANIKTNQGIRNETLERKVTGTTTRVAPPMKDMRMASTSMERKEIRREMEIMMFQKHKEILVRQLNLALNNLKQIRGRIVTRIEKAEGSGRNMTEARRLLGIADTKIATAQTQVNALANLSATSTALMVTATSTTGTSTPHIKLDRPRQLGEAAIKAVRDAREALNAVVRAIAHGMGLGGGKASTTPPTTSTTTATTTP